MSIHAPESIKEIDAALSVQWGVYFIDTDEIVAGFECEEDAEDWAADLVTTGQVYSHETQIVLLRLNIEPVVQP